MLTCSCPSGEVAWYFEHTDDFIALNTTTRKRCCSCKDFIEIGSSCLSFRRFREPKNDIEERIMGDEIDIAPWHMCEKCGDQYFNLTALGFCVSIEDNMFDLLKEYTEEYSQWKWRNNV
jgi:hypothetical protein